MLLGLAMAAEPPVEVVVEEESTPASAAERTLDRADIVATVGTSTDELLASTRGLHQSQHAGQGKAFQYFLRGFDAVHGADLAMTLEGVPLNEVSNVHGHGYLDLHFIPRELVIKAQLSPGVYSATIGDFGVAGSGELSLGLTNPGLSMAIGGGTDTSGRASLAYRPEKSREQSFILVDAEAGQGVGSSREHRQVRAAGGLAHAEGPLEAKVWVLAYDGVFSSPGVVRELDVESGSTDFLGAYPNSGGGESRRLLGGASVLHQQEKVALKAVAWTGARQLLLTQNFTGFYENLEQGDAVAQTHDALTGGARFDGLVRIDPKLSAEFGALAQLDQMHQTEAGVDGSGETWDPRIDTQISQQALGAYALSEAQPVDWLLAELGLRAQLFRVGLDRELDAGLGTGEAVATTSPVLAPRGRVALFPDGPAVLLLAAGRGFRSPEARGVENGRAPVSVSDGAEVSTVVRLDPIELRAGAFGTDISNEIVFDHVSARFLTTGSTRRTGAYGGVTAHIASALDVDLDVTASEGRYLDTGEPIPYAPRLLAVLAATTDALVTGAVAWTAGSRTWWLGPRPLPGGFQTTTQFVTDLTVQARVKRFTVDLDVDNVFNARWRDGEFFYASNFEGADPPSALPRRHFTAGTPFVARAGLGWRL